MSEFQRFLAKRLAIPIVFTLVAVSVIFVVLRLLSGSLLESLVTADNLSQQQTIEIQAMCGLDQPMWWRHLGYLQSILLSQFGYSILRSQPAWGVLVPRLVNTLILLAPASVTTAALSSLLGMHVGWNRGNKLEKLSIIVTAFPRSTPVLITGILFVIIFVCNLELVPAFGMYSISASPEGYVEMFASFDFLHHCILPFTVSALYCSGDFPLLARNGVAEKRGSEFLKLHHTKGFSEMQQLARVGRNSMPPILTCFALRLGMIFQGLILLEVVFGWPGIDRELVFAVQQQDYPLVQVAALIIALTVTVMNLIADVLYVYFDPTVSTSGGDAAWASRRSPKPN